MKNLAAKRFLCVLALAFVSVQAFAQANYSLNSDSKIWIEGTSNRSDWTVHATEIAGTVRMDASKNAVQQVQLTVPTQKVVSQRSTIMDRIIHDALKADANPQIKYALSNASVASGGTGAAFTLNTTGQLTLAGVTKPIEMTVTGEKLANGQVRFKGSREMLMSDFGMQRPSAMFGALQTADKITVHFDVVAAPAQ